MSNPNRNFPNFLTLLRIILIPGLLISGIMSLAFTSAVSSDSVWPVPELSQLELYIASFILFTVLALTDHLDGWLARRNNQITEFGKFWDPVADKLLVLAGFVLVCIEYPGQFWGLIAPMSIIAIREIIVTVARRAATAQSGQVLAAKWLGKAKTVTELLSIGCFLLYPLIPLQPLGYLGLGLLYLAMVLAWISAIDILRTLRRRD
jgi:CDP-diacylglycerol--glycerol-3-phosphate 3-phosphatidyltransferase